jgi:hypothetical protein
MTDQISIDLNIPVEQSKLDQNPMVRVHGYGPKGKQCKTCKHLISHRPGQNRYYKCTLRGITHGPGTDHRVRWAACAMYEG